MRSSIVPFVILGSFLVTLGSSGCENSTFMEVQKQRESFINIVNGSLSGQQRLEFRIEVGPADDMIHPHFEGRWTFASDSRPIDVYVIPSASYDRNIAPGAHPVEDIFWSSIVGGNSGVGTQRETAMQLHPKPGGWVVVVYNPLQAGFGSSVTFSILAEINFFR